MVTATLQLFWDLASYDPAVRKQSAQSLVTTLAEFQKAHEATLEKDGNTEVADSVEALERVCAPDVSYSLRRLIRGLPSPRQGARQGFSLALTELLSITEVVTTSLVLQFLFECTERKGSMSGEEVRDVLFGRLFGFMAIIASGMLSRSTTTMDDINKILDSLLEIGRLKAYLMEVCYYVVINMLPNLKGTKFKDEAVQKILEQFLPACHNIDQLNLAIAFRQQMPEVDLTAPLADWESKNILSSANLKRLSVILKESTMDEDENQADWKPQLHSVWDRILTIYLDQPAAATEGRDEQQESTQPKKKQKTNVNGDAKAVMDEEQIAPFAEFWRLAVDETLFDNNSSHGRKYWGFMLVQKVLPRLSSEQVPLIFTENFMRTFINNLSTDSRYLNGAARHTATVIQNVALTNKNISVAVLSQLLGKYGNQQFDRITKTKTVEKLISNLDKEGVRSYLEYLAKIFIQHPESERVESVKKWSLTQMVQILKNNNIPKEEDWIIELLRFLMVYAFFDVKKSSHEGSYLTNYRKPKPALSDELRTFCQARFQDALVSVSKMPPTSKISELQSGTLKSRRLLGIMEDGELWIYKALQIFESLQNEKKLKIHEELTEESQESYRKAMKRVNALREKLAEQGEKSTHEVVERGFEILFVNVILHLLVDQDEARSILDELFDCYDKTFKKEKKSSKKKHKKKDPEKQEEDLQPEPIDVIVDILVSFLTNESPVLKNLSEQVFEIFSHKVTKRTLDILLNILTTDDRKHGGEELFEEDDVEMLDSDNVDDDVELIDETEQNGEVDEELRKKIEETMREQGVLGGEDDEDDASDLDDEAMVAFDEKLAEVFKQKKLEKNADKSMQQSVVHFKNNVMDLIIIFVRKNPTSSLIFELIVPLLNAIRATPNKSVSAQFVTKTVSFLKNRLSVAKEHPKATDESIIDVVRAVQEFSKTSNKEQAAMCENLLVYLRKCILGRVDVDPSTELPANVQNIMDKFMSIYRENLQEYMTKRSSRVHANQFKSLAEKSPYTSWALMDSLVEYIDPCACVNHFRHGQVIEWISSIIKRTVGKKSASYDEKFMSVVPTICQKVEKAVRTSIDRRKEKVSLEYEHMRGLIRFVTTLVKLHKRMAKLDAKEMRNLWKADLLSGIPTVDVYNKHALQVECKQLDDLIG